MIEQIYNFKIGIRYVGTMLVLLLVSAIGIILWASEEQERTAIEQAKDFAVSVHQMTMAGLTGMMMTGTVPQRSIFLDQIKQSNNVRDLRVVRNEPVVRQFGAGTNAEHAADEFERGVLISGQSHSRVEREGGEKVLRVVMPAIASKNYLGKNCLMCHTVTEGTVLGAVSMSISLANVDAAVADFRLKIAAATLGFCVLLLGVIYWGTGRFVTAPLNELTHGLRVIAEGEGDLTRRVPVIGRDEIAQAAEVFNQVMAKFRELIIHVRASADQVSSASRELLGNAHQVSESSLQQRERSASSAAAVEQIAERMDAVADNTGRVHQLSRGSLEQTRNGNKNLQELVRQVEQVERAVKEMATSATAFIQNTDAITAMTKQVRDIAEQTNMLALNAAIEAARAGEQGRGFAVVADEVRKLAEKSAQSANQIDEVTQELGRQSRQVESAIANGLSHLDSSRHTMAGVFDVLTEASGAVEEVVEGLNVIASSTSEQRTASHAVATNVEAIAGMADENSRRAGYTEESARHLEQLADGLQETVGRFRV